MKRLIFLSMAACLLTGCGIYGKYSRPDMETETQYLFDNIQSLINLYHALGGVE